MGRRRAGFLSSMISEAAKGAKIKKFPWIGRFGDNIISDIEKFSSTGKARTPQALHFIIFLSFLQLSTSAQALWFSSGQKMALLVV